MGRSSYGRSRLLQQLPGRRSFAAQGQQRGQQQHAAVTFKLRPPPQTQKLPSPAETISPDPAGAATQRHRSNPSRSTTSSTRTPNRQPSRPVASTAADATSNGKLVHDRDVAPRVSQPLRASRKPDASFRRFEFDDSLGKGLFVPARFEDFELSPLLLQNLQRLGFAQPTTVQAAVIPQALQVLHIHDLPSACAALLTMLCE